MEDGEIALSPGAAAIEPGVTLPYVTARTGERTVVPRLSADLAGVAARNPTFGRGWISRARQLALRGNQGAFSPRDTGRARQAGQGRTRFLRRVS